MAKKYYSETQNRTPRPRSKRLRDLGVGAATIGGATVVSVIGGTSEPLGDGHTHINKLALDEISTDEERYLYLTKEEPQGDNEPAVFTKGKVKAGFADKSKEAESAKEADHATKSDEALHADEANNAKKWDGHVFDDYLDQPVRTSDEVVFNGVRTEKVESDSGFEEGLLGKGFQLQQKSDGKSRLEVDELLVRMKAYFASLEIRELSYVGGNYVFSSAGSRIYYVEKVADGWKCYFYSDDGTTSTMNYWKVGDQARCQTFNIEEGTHTSASNKYYWRKVTAVGSGRIEGKKNADGSDDLTEYKWAVLSDTDFDGDDVPEPYDRIVQMGSRNIESRQGLIYLVVEGENAPAIMEYSGVGAEYPYYVLPEPTLLLSPKKNIIHGEFHSVAYGGGGSGSIDQQIQDLMNQLEEVKAQNDQKMDIWFYSHSPLPTNDNTSEVNAPASEWVTDEQKALHIHDLFYDTSRNAGSAGGRAWKWVFEDNHYFWAEVTDQDTLAALEKIADVASDGILTGGAEKSRVLVDWNACVSEYDKYVGQAEEFKKQKPELVTVTLDAYKTAFIGLGTLLNGGAAWAVSDGVPSWLVNIQEDTTIPDPENYREAWAVYYAALSALLKAITDAAKALADDAQEAADDAQETADGAVGQLENMAADNIITLQEKLTLSHLWDNVKATHTQLDAEAVKYGVAHTDYDNAFNAIRTLVEKILASTTDYTLTASDGYTTKWSTYYTQESALYAAIVTAAKKVADDAQKAADDAQTTADGAVSQLENMAADNIITLQEKLTLSHLWDNVKATHTQLDAEAVKYGVAHTDYDNAFNAIRTLVEKILASTTDYTLAASDGYTTKWGAYYTQESALYSAIVTTAKKIADDAQKAADDAQTTADGAVSQLENMAADNIITLQEKLTLSHLWDNVKATHTQLDAEAVKYGVAHTDYDNAFNAIRTLVEKILASTTDYTLTASDGYTTKWSTYYTLESALYAAIVTAAKKVADDAQKTAEDAQNTAEHRMQFFASQPTPPYNVGDMWLDSSIIKVCTKARTKSETFHSEDWKQFTDYSSVQDPRILLAAFANAYYNSYKDKLQQSGNVNIFINTAANDSPAGSIKYDAQGGSIFMCSSGTNSWVRPTSISNGTTIATTIDALYNCMGAVTLTVYSNVPATGMKQYDIVIRTVSYYDHFKKENISGKCEILMYNGTCWEVLQESVTSIIDNLGDQLRLIVFGSNGTNEVDSSGLITRTTFNELFSQKVTTDANGLITNINKSGLLTSADFSTLFSSALASDGTVVKKSEITAFVTKDENGYLQSGVKIKADQIELEGVVSANKNFKIDQYGNMVAVNATVTGTLNVRSGKIGGFWVSGTGLTNQNQDPDDEDNYGKFNNDAYIIFRNDNHKCFAGIGGNVLPATSGVRGVARFENEDESDQWGFGRNYALLVSAKNGSENDAIYISGGCITRLAVKTQAISTSGSTISAGAGSVVFLNSSEINTYLPDVFQYDDGHVVKLKNANGGNVKIYPGTSEQLVKASSLSWYDKGIATTYYDSNYYKAAILSNKNPVKIQIVLPEGYTLYVQQWKTNDGSKTLTTLTSSDGLIKNESFTEKGTKTIYCDANCGIVVIMLFKSYNTITTAEAVRVIGTVKVTYNAYINADRSEIFTKTNPDNLESAGDATEYVFHKELYVKKDNKYYSGCWVQYKHPRDW